MVSRCRDCKYIIVNNLKPCPSAPKAPRQAGWCPQLVACSGAWNGPTPVGASSVLSISTLSSFLPRASYTSKISTDFQLHDPENSPTHIFETTCYSPYVPQHKCPAVTDTLLVKVLIADFKMAAVQDPADSSIGNASQLKRQLEHAETRISAMQAQINELQSQFKETTELHAEQIQTLTTDLAAIVEPLRSNQSVNPVDTLKIQVATTGADNGLINVTIPIPAAVPQHDQFLQAYKTMMAYNALQRVSAVRISKLEKQVDKVGVAVEGRLR